MKKKLAFRKLFFCVLLAIGSILFMAPVQVNAGEEKDIVLIHHHSESCMGDITEYRDADFAGHTGSTFSICPYCGGMVEHYVFEGRCSCGRTWYETGYACVNSMYGDTPSGCPYYEEVVLNTGHMHTSRGYVCGKEGKEVGKIVFDISTKDPAAEVVLKATYEGELATPSMRWEEERGTVNDKTQEGEEDEEGKEESKEEKSEEEKSEEEKGEEGKNEEEKSEEGKNEEGLEEGPDVQEYPQKTSSITVKKNGRYNFYATYEEDGEYFSLSRYIEIENIDAAPPVMEIVQTPEEWTEGECTVEIIAEDDGFGLDRLPYSFDGGVTWTDNPVYILTGDTSLEIVVRDLAGNEVKESRTVSRQKPPAPAQPSDNSWQDPENADIVPEVPTVEESVIPKLPQEEFRVEGAGGDDGNDEGNENNGEENIGEENENPDDERTRDETGADDREKEYPTAVLGVSIEVTPDGDAPKPGQPAVSFRAVFEKMREFWKELPVPAKTAFVTTSSVIGAGLLLYGLLMILGTAKISWINEKGKCRFLARLPIRKEDGCISLHLRKEAMQSAQSSRIRICLPGYYTKLHRYLPLMFSFGGRIYPMHVEERMELDLDDIR